eukprot:1446308-Prymnesium_polylepis.1
MPPSRHPPAAARTHSVSMHATQKARSNRCDIRATHRHRSPQPTRHTHTHSILVHAWANKTSCGSHRAAAARCCKGGRSRRHPIPAESAGPIYRSHSEPAPTRRSNSPLQLAAPTRRSNSPPHSPPHLWCTVAAAVCGLA